MTGGYVTDHLAQYSIMRRTLAVVFERNDLVFLAHQAGAMSGIGSLT